MKFYPRLSRTACAPIRGGVATRHGSAARIDFMSQLIAFIALRIYPFVVLGIALKKSTNIAEITTALASLRLHRGIILSIVVMIRYLPAMKDDFRVIVDAMRPAIPCRSAMLYAIR